MSVSQVIQNKATKSSINRDAKYLFGQVNAELTELLMFQNKENEISGEDSENSEKLAAIESKLKGVEESVIQIADAAEDAKGDTEKLNELSSKMTELKKNFFSYTQDRGHDDFSAHLDERLRELPSNNFE